MTEERPAKSITPAAPTSARSGRLIGVSVLSLILSGGALGAAGYLWWQQQQQLVAQQGREADLQASLYSVSGELGTAKQHLNQFANQQKQMQEQLGDLSAQRDLLQQKVDMVDQRIAKVVEGTARIDWMLGEVVQLVTVAERRLSLLGDVSGALALLESAETVVKAMEEPQARALRQALIDDILSLRSAQSAVIDTEGLLMRINSTKQQVAALEPPRPTFETEPVVLPPAMQQADTGFALFWYKVKSFVSSLVRFQKNKEPLVSIAVDPQARFYLQQSILLLLDQAQLAVLRGEPSTYALSLQEATDRVQRYLRVDTPEGERVMRELKELSQQSVKQKVPEISASLLALDAFRQAWDKGRSAREAAAARLQEAASAVDDASAENASVKDAAIKNTATENASGANAAGRLP